MLGRGEFKISETLPRDVENKDGCQELIVCWNVLLGRSQEHLLHYSINFTASDLIHFTQGG